METQLTLLLDRIAEYLKANNKFLCCAESCTGGYLSHLLTAHPHSAKHFNGAVICYSPELKSCLLDVSKAAIKKEDAVNEQCAIEMLQGALKHCKSDFAIAITGFAGPDGGTEQNPVGTVWIAVGNLYNQKTARYILNNDRERNIVQFAELALQFMSEYLDTTCANSHTLA